MALSWLSCLSVYTNLHRLELDLDSYDEPDPRVQGKLKGLQMLLGNAKHLQCLWLSLPRDYANTPRRPRGFRYDNIFPAFFEWPKLVALSVHNISLHMKDFIYLFAYEKTNLKVLEIGNIELLSGTWEAAIEVLKTWPMDLISFCINFHELLWDSGPKRRNFIFDRHGNDSRNNYDPRSFVRKTHQYVNYSRRDMSRRHPCLNPRSPSDAALGYLHEARETCETTGARPDVLAFLDMYIIETATKMYAQQKERLERRRPVDEEGIQLAISRLEI